MHHLTRFSLARPWITLLGLLAITAFLALGVPKVQPAYGFRVLIGDDHPAILTLDSIIEEFSGGLPVQIGWECGSGHPCQHVFDESSLLMAEELIQRLSAADRVHDVQGPANAPLLVPGEGGFQLRRFVEGGSIPADVDQLARRALADPLWVGELISADGRVGVIVLQPSDNRPETDLAVVESIESALDIFREQGFVFHVEGDAPEVVEGGRSLSRSTQRLIPLLALVIAIILWLLTRSWIQSLIALVTMGLALVWALGVLGWLGWPEDSMLQVLAPIIVIVGVCDAVHLLERHGVEWLRAGADPRASGDAMIAATKIVGPACLITTLTTMAAFLSFTTSDLETFLRFGTISAIGVANCLFLSFSLLPILACLRPPRLGPQKKQSKNWDLILAAISDNASKRAAPLLIASFLLIIFFAVGWLTKLRIDQDWIESYGEQSRMVQTIRFFENHIGGTETLEVEIELPSNVDFSEPETLRKIEEFSHALGGIDGLSSTHQLLDLLKRLNRLLHDDDPAFEEISETAQGNAQLLELLAIDDANTVARWLSLDQRRIRISVDADVPSYLNRIESLAEVEAAVASILPPDWRAKLSGEFAIQHDWVHDVQGTQSRSFPSAFLIVFVMVSLFLRSWTLGIAAMLPTLLPVVIVLGALGWLDMSLDVARAMIAAVVIGIGVDDAIHLLSHYRRARQAGDGVRPAMDAALRESGRAIVTTSLALSLGFLTLMTSAWQTIASFGFFVAAAIVGALVATLFVLPALVFSLAPREES